MGAIPAVGATPASTRKTPAMSGTDAGNGAPSGQQQQTTPPPAGQQQTTPPPELGEGGHKALQAERDARAKAEREAAAAKAEADELRKKHQTTEERALEDAKKAGRAEALAETNAKLVRSEVKALAAGKLADPADAAALLGDLDRFVVKGEVDGAAIAKAIDELVKAKPYLAAGGSRATALPGGGKTTSSGQSFNDTLRRKIRGG